MNLSEAKKIIAEKIAINSRTMMGDLQRYFLAKGFIEGVNSVDALKRPEVQKLVKALKSSGEINCVCRFNKYLGKNGKCQTCIKNEALAAYRQSTQEDSRES